MQVITTTVIRPRTKTHRFSSCRTEFRRMLKTERRLKLFIVVLSLVEF